jgi:chemotaxis protein MotA
MPIIGIVIAFMSLMIAVVLEGGTPMAFINLPAWLIVFGGTCGAGMASYSVPEFVHAMKQIPRAIKKRPDQLVELRDTFLEWQKQIRGERGLLSIEDEVEAHQHPFLRRAMKMVISGRQEQEIQEVLEQEIAAVNARHTSVINLFKALGGYAPTYGIIGTVMGLVNVLAQLDDPGELGHAIAVAFIATLVGVASANVMWYPIASSLKHQHEAEMAEYELIVTGALGIQANRESGRGGSSSAAMRELLDATIKPSQKITFKRSTDEPKSQ